MGGKPGINDRAEEGWEKKGVKSNFDLEEGKDRLNARRALKKTYVVLSDRGVGRAAKKGR